MGRRGFHRTCCGALHGEKEEEETRRSSVGAVSVSAVIERLKSGRQKRKRKSPVKWEEIWCEKHQLCLLSEWSDLFVRRLQMDVFHVSEFSLSRLFSSRKLLLTTDQHSGDDAVLNTYTLCERLLKSHPEHTYGRLLVLVDLYITTCQAPGL